MLSAAHEAWGVTQADICQLGMDQRKVNMLAREYCDAIKRKNKPIILSHRTRLPCLFTRPLRHGCTGCGTCRVLWR